MGIKLQITAIVMVLLFVMYTGQAFGQQIEFNAVLLQGTQSLGNVDCFAQDENGIMWVATKTGLYSYDGIQVTAFRNDPSNPNSLSGNLLTSVIADKNGIIWTGSLATGLDRFDSKTGTFTHFQHNQNDPASLINDTIIVILRDMSGTLWIGTHQGLEKFNPETNSFIHYQHNKNDPTSLSNNQVRAICEDRQGTLWVGTGSPQPNNGGGPEDGGLNRLNKETGTFTRYMHDPNNNNSLVHNKVSAIFEDNKGTLWIGTAKNGIHKMNRQNGTFERVNYDPEHPENYKVPNSSMPFDYKRKNPGT